MENFEALYYKTKCKNYKLKKASAKNLEALRKDGIHAIKAFMHWYKAYKNAPDKSSRLEFMLAAHAHMVAFNMLNNLSIHWKHLTLEDLLFREEGNLCKEYSDLVNKWLDEKDEMIGRMYEEEHQ